MTHYTFPGLLQAMDQLEEEWNKIYRDVANLAALQDERDALRDENARLQAANIDGVNWINSAKSEIYALRARCAASERDALRARCDALEKELRAEVDAHSKTCLQLATAINERDKTLLCGHPCSLMLKSTETGADLYCELCDSISGRRDAEQMETELRAKVASLESFAAAQPAVCEPKAEDWRMAIGECGCGSQNDWIEQRARQIAAGRKPASSEATG